MRWLVLVLVSCLLLISSANAATYIIYQADNSYDGKAWNSTDASFSTLRAAPGSDYDYAYTGSTSSTNLIAAGTTDVYSELNRGLFWFDIGTVADDETVTSAALVLNRSYTATAGLGESNLVLTGCTATPALSADDYDDFTSSIYATNISYAAWNASLWGSLNFTSTGISTLNAGVTGGNICMMTRLAADVDNSLSGLTWGSGKYTAYFYYENAQTGTTKDPYLEIETTEAGADTTPLASITGVVNQSLTCNSADWSWTNPGDSDYGGLKYWINNTLQTNLSNTTVKLNLTGLPGNTAITFSSKTFDLTGNINATFVNNTVTTPACADTTPPASITGLTNTSVSCNQLFFNWTNPGDSDYGGLMLWRNNTALTNLSNVTTGVSWDGLPGSTAITFSSKTFDLTGNVNASFVNMTRNTDACGAAPVADFSANDTTVCTTDPILFTDLSTNTPTSWSWSFGDGNSSAEQNPVHTYNITGLFTVGLVATNEFGEDEEEKVGYINVTECAAPTPTPTPTPAPTPANTCIFANMTGVVLLENSTNLSVVSGETSWGLTILNATEGNVSYFQCGSIVSPGGSGGGEAIGIVFGILGGMVGGIVIMRRGGSV